MSLTKCWDCESEISDTAMSCPHCGAVLRELRNPISQFIGSVLSWFVALGLIFFSLVFMAWQL